MKERETIRTDQVCLYPIWIHKKRYDGWIGEDYKSMWLKCIMEHTVTHNVEMQWENTDHRHTDMTKNKFGLFTARWLEIDWLKSNLIM